MQKIYSTIFIALIALTLYSCGEKTFPMPENKILKEEFNLTDNSQDFSIYMKSLDTTTAVALVAVSYTHLDVYKRQVLKRAGIFYVLFIVTYFI